MRSQIEKLIMLRTMHELITDVAEWVENSINNFDFDESLTVEFVGPYAQCQLKKFVALVEHYGLVVAEEGENGGVPYVTFEFP